MTKEQMHEGVARLNNKIEIELTEIKSLAQRILNGADNPYNISFHTPSRMIAQSEANIKELLARRDTLKEILENMED